MMSRISALLLIASLLACSPLPPVDEENVNLPDAGPDLSSCGAAELTGLIGAPVSALADSGDWGALRIIRPGDAVTADFSETRLNVELDAQDRILRLSCG